MNMNMNMMNPMMNNNIMNPMMNPMMNNMMNPMISIPPENRINILFKAITGVNYNMTCDKNLPISQVFKEYLARINKESLYENNSNIIQFIFNGKAIEFKNNNMKLVDFFRTGSNVEIQIVTNDLIGA